MNFQFSIFKKKELGHTIVEMMVVISIIAFLSSISISIYQGSQRELALQRAANKLAEDLRRAQGMAMAAKEFGGTIPRGGYGAYFNLASSTSYVLFADTDGGRDYDKPTEKVKKIEIESGVQISNLSPASLLNITFTPPDPTTLINGTTTTATIVLQIDNSTTSVKVLPSGLIYIE